MKEQIEIETLISLYKDEHEKFIKNDFCRAKHEYEILSAYKDKLSVLRDTGFKHENLMCLRTMSSIIQADIDEIRKKMNQLEPILNESQREAKHICEYETRVKKMDVLKNMMEETFQLTPAFEDGKLLFRRMK